MSKIPGIEKPLTKKQRTAAEERMHEVPSMFQGAVREAIDTGYIPERTSRMILLNQNNRLGASVIEKLHAL